MLYPPHWFEGGRVAGQSGNDMPVDVGKLVAEEFIIEFPGLIDPRDDLGDQVHFLHQHNPFRGSQMKQLCRVAFEDNDGPTAEELIVVQIGLGEAEVSDEMVFFRPAALAGATSIICHGWLALRHSSSVTTPFLINN